jgi:hypothetical protein
MSTKPSMSTETKRDVGTDRWLVIQYQPTSLFSLKMSAATSAVGKTLLIPTPYAVKMAFLEAAFRTGWEEQLDALVRALARADLRIGVPQRATVTHTIVKIRQEYRPKKGETDYPPYNPAVAYREFVHYEGLMRWAFDRGSLTEDLERALRWLAPAIFYIGKRGGFVQFKGVEQRETLTPVFTQLAAAPDLPIPIYSHLATLDDFGPEANLEALNSYSSAPIRREKHRKFVETVVPLGLVSVGPGFTEYHSGAIEEK